jgi:hypothetical protein
VRHLRLKGRRAGQGRGKMRDRRDRQAVRQGRGRMRDRLGRVVYVLHVSALS